MAENNGKSSNDGQAVVALVVAAIVAMGAFFFMSTNTWKASEARIDYEIALMSSKTVWLESERFIEKSSWGPVGVTSKMLELTSSKSKYSTEVLNKFNKSELRTTLVAMGKNATLLSKYDARIKSYERWLSKGKGSITSVKKVKNEIKRLKSKELELRSLHSNLYAYNMDQLASLQKDVISSYMMYLIPFMLLIIGMSIFIIKKYITVKKIEPSFDAMEKASLYIINDKWGEVSEKAFYGTASRPVMNNKWKQSEFGKKVYNVWKDAGYEFTTLAENVSAYLFAHKDTPASISGHNCYPGGLLDHTVNVLKKALEFNKEKEWSNFRGELLLLAALSHDVGKCVTFYFDEKTNAWYDKGSYHDKESGWILQSFPGFLQMEIEHRLSLLMAVKNRHDRDSIPNNYPSFSLVLFKALSVVDDQAGRDEVADVKTVANEASSLIDEIWGDAISSLNVNGYKEGKKEGHYDKSQNIIIVPEPQLTAAIIKHLPEHLKSKMPKKASNNEMHPLWKAIHSSLLLSNKILGEVEFLKQNKKVKANSMGFIQMFAYADLIRNGVVINIEGLPSSLIESWDVVDVKSLKIKPVINDGEVDSNVR